MTIITQEEARDLMWEPQRYIFTGTEKKFEDLITESIAEICHGLELPPIARVKRQQTILVGSYSIRPDIFIWHTDGTGSILEVKLSNCEHPAAGRMSQAQALGQLMLYGEVVISVWGDGKFLPRLFLFDNKIYPETHMMASRHRLPISLVEIQGSRVFIPYHYYKGGGGVVAGEQKEE